MNDYELSGIENIARGVCVRDGKVLLCRPRGGSYSYLPGGHIEFGETSREALVREMREETGRPASADYLLGVVESSFEQKGKRHCEISLVYSMSVEGELSTISAQEDWIEFVWWPVDELEAANMLPPEMRKYIK